MDDVNNNIKKFYEAYKEFNSKYEKNFDIINEHLEIFNFVRDVYNDDSKLNTPIKYFNNHKLLYDSFLLPSNKSNNQSSDYNSNYKNYQFVNYNNKTVLFVDLENLGNDDLDISADSVLQVTLNDIKTDYDNKIEKPNGSGIKLIDVENYNKSTIKSDGECNLDTLKECYSKSVLQDSNNEEITGKFFGLKDKFNEGGNTKECECYYSINNESIPADANDYYIKYVDVELPFSHGQDTPSDIYYLSILLDGKLYSIHKENYEDVFNNFLKKKDNTITVWNDTDSVITTTDKCNTFAGSGIYELDVNLEKYTENVKTWHDQNCISST